MQWVRYQVAWLCWLFVAPSLHSIREAGGDVESWRIATERWEAQEPKWQS